MSSGDTILEAVIAAEKEFFETLTFNGMDTGEGFYKEVISDFYR